MSAQTCGCEKCGCSTLPCGCCEGVQKLTPADETNRPGLSALRYRVGTHGQFFETMKARLTTMVVDGVASDGQTPATFRPLQGLTTRDTSDFSIALLDSWATVGDVLTFYQERIANENYLRTATERRSVLELARLVGYRLRPGVAASTFLAYTIDAKQVAPLTIPTGSAAQSVPNPGEQPQTFETIEDVVTRPEWNNLQVRLKQPQDIRFDNVLATDVLYVAGVSTNLKAGDKLLFTFADDGSSAAIRTVASIDSQVGDQRTAISLQPVDSVLLECEALLVAFIEQVKNLDGSGPAGAVDQVVANAEDILNDVYLGAPTNPVSWSKTIASDAQHAPQSVQDAIKALGDAIVNVIPPDTSKAVTDPSKFVQPLLTPPVLQARNSLSLSRTLRQAFGPAQSAASGVVFQTAAGKMAQVQSAQRYSDVSTQLLVNFVPHLAQSYYDAWAGAQLNPSTAPLKAVYAMRSRASLFGATASKLPQYSTGEDNTGLPAGVLLPQNFWTDWDYADDETGQNAFLDGANEAITPGSFAVAELDGERQVLRIAEATTSPRSEYGLSGQTTAVEFALATGKTWRTIPNTGSITSLRKTKLYVQSDPLTLIDEPLTDAIDSQTIPLDGLYKELISGRWVILSGERADIEAVNGVTVAELQMISGLSHGFDPNLPGDNAHTTLVLATPLAYSYKRGTLKIYGNVVKATHGATRKETLGSGNGAQVFQSFTLMQPPVTFVAAPTAEGADSTLHVYVDNIEWHESESLAFLDAKSRGFVTQTDDDSNTTVMFGDGEHGSRVPTGVQNITAVYRSGIGAGGNVNAGQITNLQSRPLGVTAVINPLRASGGADAESRDLARENAPLSVMPLDRLVSVQDYEDLTRRFAGIAKALARSATDGSRSLVYLTIAGTDDVPIDVTSDLYRNLLDALRTLGDPDLPLRVDLRERNALVLSAGIKILPDFRWEPVVSDVRTALLDAFGFDKRKLGQNALLSEAISVMQRVRGVAWVDVDAFGAVPERVWQPTTLADGTVRWTRELITQDAIHAAVDDIIDWRTPWNRELSLDRMPPNVDAWPGGLDPTTQTLRPAEIIAFTPEVTDTLILNQIP